MCAPQLSRASAYLEGRRLVNGTGCAKRLRRQLARLSVSAWLGGSCVLVASQPEAVGIDRARGGCAPMCAPQLSRASACLEGKQLGNGTGCAAGSWRHGTLGRKQQLAEAISFHVRLQLAGHAKTSHPRPRANVTPSRARRPQQSDLFQESPGDRPKLDST